MQQVTLTMHQKLSDNSHSDLAAALTHLATISRGWIIPRKTSMCGKTTIINAIESWVNINMSQIQRLKPVIGPKLWWSKPLLITPGSQWTWLRVPHSWAINHQSQFPSLQSNSIGHRMLFTSRNRNRHRKLTNKPICLNNKNIGLRPSCMPPGGSQTLMRPSIWENESTSVPNRSEEIEIYCKNSAAHQARTL